MSFGGQDSGSYQPNREELIQMGIRAAKAGNRDAARIAFEQVLSQDKKNERSMMWMAKLAESKAERKKWLDRVLLINPDNEAAKDALKQIAYRRSSKENRTLLIFGMVAGVLAVLAVVIVVFVLSTAR